MSNTITITALSRTQRKVVLYVTILSDGTEETGTVIYDSSVQTALIKDQNNIAMVDPLNCKIQRIQYSTTSTTVLAHLLFDATTDVLAVGIPFDKSGCLDFRSVGGLPNYAGTGKTGDILLTTTNFNAGETMTLVLEVTPS